MENWSTAPTFHAVGVGAGGDTTWVMATVLAWRGNRAGEATAETAKRKMVERRTAIVKWTVGDSELANGLSDVRCLMRTHHFLYYPAKVCAAPSIGKLSYVVFAP